MSTSPTPPTTTPATIQIADRPAAPAHLNGHPDRRIEHKRPACANSDRCA